MDTTININDWNQFWIQQALVFVGVVVAGIFAWKTWKTTQFNNQIYTDEILFNAKKETKEIGLKMVDIDTENPSKKDKQVVKFYWQIIEDVLNAYELSCELYLSGGVDKNRFERLRKKEVVKLFGKDEKGGYFYPKLHEKPNQYTAIESVYNKFKSK